MGPEWPAPRTVATGRLTSTTRRPPRSSSTPRLSQLHLVVPVGGFESVRSQSAGGPQNFNLCHSGQTVSNVRRSQRSQQINRFLMHANAFRPLAASPSGGGGVGCPPVVQKRMGRVHVLPLRQSIRGIRLALSRIDESHSTCAAAGCTSASWVDNAVDWRSSLAPTLSMRSASG
jgi:hypothetical protein